MGAVALVLHEQFFTFWFVLIRIESIDSFQILVEIQAAVRSTHLPFGTNGRNLFHLNPKNEYI